MCCPGYKTFPLSSSVESLEVVIIPTAQTCWSRSGEKTGKVLQYPLNQTDTLW